jgi:hypothetical protein
MSSKKDAKSKHTHKHCEDALAWVRRQDKGSKITLDSSTDLEAAPGCTEQSDAATQAIDIADDNDQFSVSTPAHSNSSERLVDATPSSVDQRLSKRKSPPPKRPPAMKVALKASVATTTGQEQF